jgi:pimeloyl-[acyl-carrier protein] synthase
MSIATAKPVTPLVPKVPLPARFNPLLPEYIIDPHPQLHRLRSEDPVHWSSTLGVWVLTRYVDVHAALRDSRFSCMAGRWEQYQKFFLRGGSATSPMAEMYKRWMLQVDPPDHTRLRGLVNKAFTPRVVEKMRPAVQRSVDELVNRVVASGRMDVMSDLAFPLPIMVICDLLGVPREDNDKIREWTAALLPSLSPAISAAGVERVNAVIVEYREYFRELARQRRAEPKDDMLSALIAAEENDQKLTEEELLATCILLAFAGHATTAQLTGRAMHFLLQHPDQRQKLMDDPSLIVNAIEEVCRYDSMLQLIYRTTKEPVTIGDKTIPANQMVFLSLAGANRDPLQFPDPDRFDITRDAGKHIAFAYGIHYCVGAPLARLEGQIAVNTMLRRLPDLKLNQAGIRREPSLLLRGLTALPVTFGSDSN